ncbi:MAG: response regulator, partial [Verrucomicrobia bacterium]|nr:response regulator [Verrucomicrobiota bacterium]
MADVPPPKILIVDDEVAQMKALCDTLRDHGYETVGYSSANAALAALDKTEFDLLLTDLMMPEMDGIELLQGAFKKRPLLVGIMMTGEGTITAAVEAMKSGA